MGDFWVDGMIDECKGTVVRVIHLKIHSIHPLTQTQYTVYTSSKDTSSKDTSSKYTVHIHSPRQLERVKSH